MYNFFYFLLYIFNELSRKIYKVPFKHSSKVRFKTYKNKYLKLCKQIGGGKDITFTDGTRILVILAKDNIPLEIKVNLIDKSLLSRERIVFLGDRLYYGDQDNVVISPGELDILTKEYRKINGSAETRQIGGAPPQYFYNKYHESNPNKPTIAGIDDTQALKNGEFLLGKLSEYLSFTKASDVELVESYKWFTIFFPTTYLTETEGKKYIDFYSKDENKIWLGRQAYLFTTQKDIRGISGDDLLHFFNWLTHRLSSIPFDVFDGPAPIV